MSKMQAPRPSAPKLPEKGDLKVVHEFEEMGGSCEAVRLYHTIPRLVLCIVVLLLHPETLPVGR